MVKAVRDALHEKVENCKDLKMEFEKIQKIAEEIEIAMFGKIFKFPFRTLGYLDELTPASPFSSLIS